MISLTLLYVFMAAKWQHVTVIVWGHPKVTQNLPDFNHKIINNTSWCFPGLDYPTSTGILWKWADHNQKARFKRTQHCWSTPPDFVGCYLLRPFTHPVACCCELLGVVAQSLKPVKLLAMSQRTQQLPTLLGQQYWELLPPFERNLCRDSY